MEQMASRAFSQVLVEIERRDVDILDSERNDVEFNCRKKKKVKISEEIFIVFLVFLNLYNCNKRFIYRNIDKILLLR